MNKEEIESLTHQIKKDFFTFRNGIIADAVRKLYPQGTFIYGLTVPQFTDISKKYHKDLDLALSLWSEKSCRESRILALYLFPVEKINFDTALFLLRDVSSNEEAELLPFRVLRHLPFAEKIVNSESNSIGSDATKYALEMLKKNLQASCGTPSDSSLK